MNRRRTDILTPDDELDEILVEPAADPIEPAPALGPVATVPPSPPKPPTAITPTFSQQWRETEAAFARIADGTATAADQELVGALRLNKDDYKAELNRVTKVQRLKLKAGSWEQLKQLEDRAKQLATEADTEKAAMQAELDELTARVRNRTAELDGATKAVTDRSVEMKTANLELRQLVPDHVKRVWVSQSQAAMTEFVDPINELTRGSAPGKVS